VESSRSLLPLALSFDPVTLTFNGDPAKNFKFDLWESFTAPYVLPILTEKKCVDRKNVFWGESPLQQLSLKLRVGQRGTVHVCSMSPHTKVFLSLDDVAQAFLTENVTAFDSFAFDPSRAREVPLVFVAHHPARHSCCTKVGELISPGSHVLTIVPKGNQKVFIAYLLVP
jgi:hypothetical protein